MAQLSNQKILVTGATSQVALPLCRSLSVDNEVVGLGRFRKPEDEAALRKAGGDCLKFDLATGDPGRIPDDFDYVLNFAVVKSGNFAYDLAANAEGLGRLLSRCRNAKAVLHCSSAAVYEYAGHKPLTEDDALGDNHRNMFPTYSISKIVSESVARFAAAEWNLPTTIARLSVPYGNNGGWPWYHLMMMNGGHKIPVHPDSPSLFNPIHEDDYIAQVPLLLERASVPALTLNWGGESVSIEDWCAYLGQLTGIRPHFETTPTALGSVAMNLDRLHEQVGPTRVDWRDGIRRLVEARNPELLKGFAQL